MRPQDTPVRIVFLGCGAAARMHSRLLRNMPNVDLSYGSRDLRRADACVRDFGGRKAFSSYEEAVADNADVVVVATPTASHRELALFALRAGKHVIVEKPAFMRSAEADEIRAVASEMRRQVLVAENYAYKPIARRLRRLVQQGELGEVRFVSINATKRQRIDGWRAQPELAGGGALFEGGVHWVSFVANLGLEVQEAHGYPTASDESALVVFRYANGAVGTLAYSWELPAPFGGLRLSKIQGTLGAVTFESNGLGMVVTGRSPGVYVFARDFLGYRAMWRDFLNTLRTGGEPEFTLDMAQRDLRLLEQAGATARDAEVPEHDLCLADVTDRTTRDRRAEAVALAEDQGCRTH